MIEIEGNKKLFGEVNVQGSKNTVLPILSAVLLTDGVTKIYNCPKISDVYVTIKILKDLGCKVVFIDNTLIIDTKNVHKTSIDKKFSNRLRSSIIFLGALLGKYKKASIGYPGGCKIGARPIDFHLKSFKKMNISVNLDDDEINCFSDKIIGTEINLKFASVGATENILLGSVLGEGKTIINNSAREPEICDLCDFLRKMGAKISGDGTEKIEIVGVRKLIPVEYTIPYDRIVAGTYIFSAIITNGNIILNNISDIIRINNIINISKEIGAEFKYLNNKLEISMNTRPKAFKVETKPYPDGIPTDIQSMLLAVATVSDGESYITENIFEQRYQIVDELKKMGARIEKIDNSVRIIGIDKLKSANITAYDLRGGASLVLAGLNASGKTYVNGEEYIKRGYQNIIEDFVSLGANIR